MNDRSSCRQYEGKGFIAIRDCTGEIQREETCLFCDGTGIISENEIDAKPVIDRDLQSQTGDNR